MPIYSYKCNACSHEFEQRKKIADRDDVVNDVCPECAKTGQVERTVSSALVAYSISVNGGYGSHVPDGWKSVLNKIHERSPGSRMKETSSYM